MGSLISSALPPEGAGRTGRVETVTLQNGLVTKKLMANLSEESGFGQLLSKTRLPSQANGP